MSSRRAVYTPQPLFGLAFLAIPAQEVELLGFEGPLARIRVVEPKNSLGNILAFPDQPEKRRERIVERTVLASDVTVLEADA